MQAGYRLVSYQDSNGKPVAGILVSDRVVPASDILGSSFSTVMAILASWDDMHPRIAKACEDKTFADKGVALSSVKLLAPLLYPGAFYCAGANYWDHLNEMAEIAKRTTGRDVHIAKPAEPWFFM